MKQMGDNLDAGRKMLPEPVPQALKRDGELHELLEVVMDLGRSVLLLGRPGIGKTTMGSP